MVVAGSVLLVLLALVGPIDTNLGIEDFTAVERLEGGLGSTPCQYTRRSRN